MIYFIYTFINIFLDVSIDNFINTTECHKIPFESYNSNIFFENENFSKNELLSNYQTNNRFLVNGEKAINCENDNCSCEGCMTEISFPYNLVSLEKN